MMMNTFFRFTVVCILLLSGTYLPAQELHKTVDKVEITTGEVTITADLKSGTINYLFANGTRLNNTVAYLNDLFIGNVTTADFSTHTYTKTAINDSLGAGIRLLITHTDAKYPFILVQNITQYKDKPYILVDLVAKNKENRNAILETREISPIAVLPKYHGKLFISGTEPRILDVPFDNDDWTPTLQRSWPKTGAPKNAGISYEFAAVYDQLKNSGLVIGSVKHNFWKTGLAYQTANELGYVDSLKVFGGASTPDDPKLQPAYGGNDGTHDVVEHGTMTGRSVSSPLVYIGAGESVHEVFVQYGQVNSAINGKQTWKGYAPVYWNSFGVEGVLGYEGVMMPPAVEKISDFLHTLHNFSSYAKPVMSIDSYDQGIYSTEVLADLGKYAKRNGQQMGFYFIPFAMWSWKDDINEKKIPGSNYQLKDVLLHDKGGKPIMYKDGKWGAYAMDPTHPAIRLYIIQQLKKAKAINAKFLKIDFLTAGALETSRRYDSNIRTGMQAYDYGMKTLRHLVDSILGKDIFITQAISPMFPHQYAHTRFISTDVYSHLRDDQQGFPHYGSTESSLAAGSHMGWVQGTLFPYTNLDVSIMKNFQKNPDLNEQEIKVRLYAMMVMGSILGDGSDFRNPIAAYRAQEFLNNKQVAEFFSSPKAFIPLKMADGETFDQQLSFYLPGNNMLLSLFNFDREKTFEQTFTRQTLHLDLNKQYQFKDMMSDAVVGELKKGAPDFKLSTGPANAVMIKLVEVKDDAPAK
jgi:alpha-galactosidase